MACVVCKVRLAHARGTISADVRLESYRLPLEPNPFSESLPADARWCRTCETYYAKVSDWYRAKKAAPYGPEAVERSVKASPFKTKRIARRTFVPIYVNERSDRVVNERYDMWKGRQAILDPEPTPSSCEPSKSSHQTAHKSSGNPCDGTSRQRHNRNATGNASTGGK